MKTFLVEKIELVAPGKIKPFKKNSRIHSPEQIQAIADSITEFGFLIPVLIEDDFSLIAGEGRWRASKLLKLKKIPTVKASHLTENQKRAFVIADNKLASMSEWDMDVLSEEIAELQTEFEGIDVIGFSEEELEAIISDMEEPAPPPPKTKLRKNKIEEESNDEEENEEESGEKEDFDYLKFFVSDSQLESINRALDVAFDLGLGDKDESGNTDSRANCITRICETFTTQNEGKIGKK